MYVCTIYIHSCMQNMALLSNGVTTNTTPVSANTKNKDKITFTTARTFFSYHQISSTAIQVEHPFKRLMCRKPTPLPSATHHRLSTSITLKAA